MKQAESLYTKLIEYGQSDVYPYHMPGHKRTADGIGMEYACEAVHNEDPLACVRSIDITEIEGFDNLHHAEGILKEAQEYAAQAYGARQSFYLVGGSTTGILTAVSALLPRNGRILIARNCHKSVYHAVFLRGLQVSYLQPEYEADFGVPLPVTAEAVRQALMKEPDIQAVLITSPTYEGLVADVEGIAEVVHEAGIPLIVDEAHGAHLGFADMLPPSSVMFADVVVHSTHKTTRALTQTALLHVCSDRIDCGEIQRYLDIYMTSSPSYILMASIEEAIRELFENGQQLYNDYMRRRRVFLDMSASLKYFEILKISGICGDPCKFVIGYKNKALSGQMLYDILLNHFHLQMELCQGRHVLAIMTPHDSEAGFIRLLCALRELDRELEQKMEQASTLESGRELIMSSPHKKGLPSKLPIQKMPLEEAWRKGHKILLSDSIGQVCSEFVYQYPPGVPIMVPGEVWDEAQIAYIRDILEKGYEVLGIEKESDSMYCYVL